MADIPGIQFAGSPGMERESLAEARVRPRRAFGGLSWSGQDGGSTSASPVQQRMSTDITSMSRDALVRWVWEGLEIPGEPADYHFLLQRAVEGMWSRRRADPAGLHFVEVFGYLDLVLVEAAPLAVAIGDADETRGYVQISTFDRLLAMLKREGALRDALALSRRAQRFGERYRREDLECERNARRAGCV